MQIRWALLSCALATAAWAGPELDTLRQQIAALKYADAAKTAQVVLSTEGLTRAEAIEVYVQLGIVRAALKDPTGARDAFASALSIDPDTQLPGKPSPRIATPFAEARALIRERGALTLTVDVTRPEGGLAWVAIAQPVRDPMHLVSEVRYLATEDGRARPMLGRAVAATRLQGTGRKVTITWKLVSPKQWVLAEGQLDAPELPAEPVAVVAPTAPVAPSPVAPPPTAQPTGRPMTLGLSIGLMIAGAASLAAAGVELSAAGDYARRIDDAKTWEDVQLWVRKGPGVQTAGLIFAGAGVASFGAGVGVLLWRLLVKPEPPALALSVSWSPQNVGLTLSARWP